MADEDPDEGGHKAVSTDGEGASADELKRRREARAGGSAKDRALDAEQRAIDAEDGKGDDDGDPQLEFAVPEAAKRINLGNLILKGTPTTIRYKMSGKPIQAFRGGIMDPSETNGLLLVPFVVEDVHPTFTRNPDKTIKSALVTITLAPMEIVNAVSEEGEMLLKAAQDAAAQTAAAAG